MKKIILLFLFTILSTSSIAAANIVQNVQPIGIAALDDTPVYSKPSGNPADIIFTTKYGSSFQNFKTLGNGWIETTGNTSKAYFSRNHITTYIPYPGFMTYEITSKQGYVFATPSSKSKVRAIIPNGAIVLSYGVNGDFYFVYFIQNNKQNAGFISKNVVKNLPPSPQQPMKPINNDLLLFSNDGRTFLGKVTNDELDSESICNEFGKYGSKFSPTSIWNEFGTYGSKFSTESAFNEYTATPPVVISNERIMGYLTVNKYLSNGVSPYVICN